MARHISFAEEMSAEKSLDIVIRVLAEIRKIYPHIPSQTVECLLNVAREPGLTMQTLGKMTGLAQSSCSRNVAMLSKWHRLGKPGFDLVETIDDPHERRRKIIFLTSKGQQVVSKALRHLDPRFELKDVTAEELVDGINRRARKLT